MSLYNLYVEGLTSDITVFEHITFKVVIKVK